MTRTVPTYAITCLLLLCLFAETARGAHASRGSDSIVHDARIYSIVNCSLWLSAIPECPQAPFTGTQRIASTPPSSRPLSGPDSEGIKRDTYYFLGLQLSIIGVLYLMPESVSGWSNQQKNQHHAQKWWSNVSDPTWDEDEDYINYVLHPYWGAAYYVRARERGYGAQNAFWYSFLLSTLYETGLEALFEPVSIQDFFVTPIVGSWLGGYFMDWRRATRERIARTGQRRFRDKALLVATDPLGSAAGFIDRRLGGHAEFSATPFIVRRIGLPEEGYAPHAGPRPHEAYGLKLTLRW